MATPALRGLPVSDRLLDAIGNTPLVRIEGLEGVAADVTVLGKLESRNPGGSVKDRAAWGMVRAAREAGRLKGGRRILDATSGNTGIAYAWIGAALGVGVTLCLPANASPARRRLLEALGAELTLTDPLEGTDGAIVVAQGMAAEAPARYAYLDQYANPENWRAHLTTTAREIWEQTGGDVTHLVAGIGTSGTLGGTSRGLRARKPTVRIVAVQPDSPYHALEGLKDLASARVPAIYDATLHDRTIHVSSDDAIAMTKQQARRGLLVGWSAGAALVAARAVAREIEHGTVVAILPDGAERYLDEPLWEDA